MKKIMKNFLALSLSGLMALSALAGCSSQDGKNPAGTGNGSTGSSGFSGAIDVVSREEGSGTRGAFVELLEVVDAAGDDATVSTAEIVSSTSVVSQTVSGNKNAIGYISLGAYDASLVKALQVDGVAPTVENVKNGTYAIARPFNICYKEENLTELGKDFVKFIMSAEGQAILDQSGYIAADEKAAAYEASGLSGKLSLNGSTSVGPVMEKIAEAYKALNSGVTIDIQQTGSGAGITATLDGSCEIGMSSRDLKDEELAEGLTPVNIAMDGIAVIVNQSNPNEKLTSAQIRDIFLGNVTDWAELG